jgi:hypothetical protein
MPAPDGGQPWSRSETESLRLLSAAWSDLPHGERVCRVAARLGRTRASVASKANYLHLPSRAPAAADVPIMSTSRKRRFHVRSA